MTKVVSLDKALKLWGFGLFAVVVMYYGGQWSQSTATHQSSSLLLKWTAVAIGVICMIPWLGFIAWSISLTDEYYQHVALAGTAGAFIVDALVHVAFNLMQSARIVGWSSHLLELPVGMFVWIACVAVAAVYYRLRL
jgi:hypothetical protein